MSDAGTIHVSGGLLTPGVLAGVYDPTGRHEFSAGAFRGIDGTSITAFDEWIEQGFRQFCDRYENLAADLPSMDRPTLRSRWVLPLLQYLGWEPVYQQAHLRPSTIDNRTFPISHLGWDDPAAPPIHIEPTSGREQGLDARPAPRKSSPHDDLQQFLNLAPQMWGMVTDGIELRLVRNFHHSTTKGYVAIDLQALFASRNFSDFTAMVRLAHVSRFLPSSAQDSESDPPLESLYARSRAAGVSVGKALHPQVRKAIEVLADAAVRHDSNLRAGLDDATRARAFYGEVLSVVYRLLFLFFAEQRGILPGRDSLYADSYSVTRLREMADSRSAIEGRRSDLYEGLKATFRLMRDGAKTLGIKPFGGQLFDADRTPVMSRAEISNRELLRAVAALSTVEAGGIRQHVAYATIGVEELGAVYESLLDYTPRIATVPTRAESGDPVATGNLYLERIGDRELGAYYTPADLVDFTLEVSLDRLIQERCGHLDGLEAEAALLDIRVIDPACGSGAFLVAVIDRLALALCDVRYQGAQPTETQLARARREVLQHCIYGVDVDPFAVELCKVALWIHCAVRDLPLTFLDHRIQHGNSLIGWPLRDLPDEIPVDAYPTKGKNKKADKATKEICAAARARNQKALRGQGDLFKGAVPKPDLQLDYPALWAQEEQTPADVEKKADAYAEYLDSTGYRLWDAAANLWASSFFWTADLEGDPPITTDYWAARHLAEQYRDGRLHDREASDFLGSPQVTGAAEAARDLALFHWPLRFPEIAERGGFDFVTGNPPWEVVKLARRAWFATRDAAIAGAATTPANQLIADLEETNPPLARQWRLASAAIARQADFMRYSGLYARSGNEPNTYLLFTETNARNTRDQGRAAFIVKSSLGVDKGGQPTFQPLVGDGRVHGFYDIVNGGRGQTVVFEGVADLERFAVLSLGPAQPGRVLATSMMNLSIDEARTRNPIDVLPKHLRTLNPVTRSLPSFREPEHWEIAKRLHRTHPTLDFDKPTNAELESGQRSAPTNPWDLKYARLFDSSGDSGHFMKREDLEADGWHLGDDMLFRRGEDEARPLYEGQLMNRYDHRAKTYAGYGPLEKKYGRKPGILLTTDAQKADPAYEIEPRYWIHSDVAEARIRHRVGERPLFALRDIGSLLSNQRTARGAAIPDLPASDSLPVIGVGRNFWGFIASFNSTTFDFLTGGKLPGVHVARTWTLSQLPMPQVIPSAARAGARTLSVTSHTMAARHSAVAQEWDAPQRYEVDTEVDALMAHAYQLTELEYGIVLNSFVVLARKEIAEHGRYRFKDDCLAAYRRVG